MWLFGYGSLIWRPDFPYLESHTARLYGWKRRFYQGSPDHRGVPEAPGRVVTLLQAEESFCDGVAFRVEKDIAKTIIAKLDHRESGGYEQHHVEVRLLDSSAHPVKNVLLYVASPNNPNFLGKASMKEMARQILESRGASGPNTEYLLRLAEALRAKELEDPHVFALEQTLLQLQSSD